MSQILPRLTGAAVNAFKTPVAMSFTSSSRSVTSISNNSTTTSTTVQPQGTPAFSKEYSTQNTPSTQNEGFELASTLETLNSLFEKCEGSWPVGVYWYSSKDAQAAKASE